MAFWRFLFDFLTEISQIACFIFIVYRILSHQIYRDKFIAFQFIVYRDKAINCQVYSSLQFIGHVAHAQLTQVGRSKL